VLDCKTEHLEGLHFNWQSDWYGRFDWFWSALLELHKFAEAYGARIVSSRHTLRVFACHIYFRLLWNHKQIWYAQGSHFRSSSLDGVGCVFYI